MRHKVDNKLEFLSSCDVDTHEWSRYHDLTNAFPDRRSKRHCETRERCRQLPARLTGRRSVRLRCSLLYISCGGCRLGFARFHFLSEKPPRRFQRKVAFTSPDTDLRFIVVKVAAISVTFLQRGKVILFCSSMRH